MAKVEREKILLNHIVVSKNNKNKKENKLNVNRSIVGLTAKKK